VLKGIAAAGALLAAVAAAPAAGPLTAGTPAGGTPAESAPADSAPAAIAPPRRACDGRWRIQRSALVPPKQPGQEDLDNLNAVAAISPGDQWAVGSWEQYPRAYTFHSLAEHSIGGRWTLVSSPDLARPADSSLFGITAITANDVWAVGGPVVVQPYRSLVEHWNGAAWSIVHGASFPGVLWGVAAAGPADIWAVGTLNFPGRALIEHWNGRSWTATALPFNGWLRGVTALAGDDVWAVGLRWAANGAESPLTMHFDGRTWAQVPSPRLLPGRSEDQAWLVSVSAAAARDVWAVGWYGDVAVGPRPHTLIEHWNGRRWAVVPSPNPGSDPNGNALWGVTTVSPHDVWAVGSVGGAIDPYPTTRPLIVHWTGSAWSAVPAPGTGQLLGVAADRHSSGISAVGVSTANSGYLAPLAEHRCPG